MKVSFLGASPFETQVLSNGTNPAAGILTVKPIPTRKGQRNVRLVPFQCTNDVGLVTDRGFISVSCKNGKLNIERSSAIVEMAVDKLEPTPDDG